MYDMLISVLLMLSVLSSSAETEIDLRLTPKTRHVVIYMQMRTQDFILIILLITAPFEHMLLFYYNISLSIPLVISAHLKVSSDQ